jgi:hypothetical protein
MQPAREEAAPRALRERTNTVTQWSNQRKIIRVSDRIVAETYQIGILLAPSWRACRG